MESVLDKIPVNILHDFDTYTMCKQCVKCLSIKILHVNYLLPVQTVSVYVPFGQFLFLPFELHLFSWAVRAQPL